MADAVKVSTPTTEQIIEALKQDAGVRQAVVKMIARDYPSDYLSQVVVRAEKLKDLSAAFISSDKEWQE